MLPLDACGERRNRLTYRGPILYIGPWAGQWAQKNLKGCTEMVNSLLTESCAVPLLLYPRHPSLHVCTCEDPAGWKLSQGPDALCQH